MEVGEGGLFTTEHSRSCSCCLAPSGVTLEQSTVCECDRMACDATAVQNGITKTEQ